ncbi:PASTA domain-containing protein [Nitriliruptoraceae bacterium ZYF776]|nr:PASTA domain-containing protein [Profundirhabdus halotolerans]
MRPRTLAAMSAPRSDPASPRPPEQVATPETADARLRVGGRYVLRGELGRGGMATVHRARDEVLERDVAVKLLHAHLASDPAFLDRFRREARAAAALSHPNVVAVHDWGETRDGPFLVLQLVDGPSLREVLRRRRRLDAAEALAVLAPAATGTGAAHAAGLVHRDVKPENLLLGTDGTVRVTDFGLARAAASATSTFGTDVLVGSPHYLSPEAVRGEPLDPRADVYALGVVLYEVLVGRPPYEAESPFATAVQHTSRRIPPPSRAVLGIPPALDEVVRRATDPDPAGRFADGRAFATALVAAVPGGPVPIEDLFDGGPPPAPRERPTAVLPVEATETTVGSELDLDPDDDAHLAPVGWYEDDTPAVDWDDAEQPWPVEPDVDADADAEVTDAEVTDAEVTDAEVTDADPPLGNTGSDGSDVDDHETDEGRVVHGGGRRRGWLVVLIVLLLLAASAGGGYLLWDRVLAPVLDIPELAGSEADSAVATLEELGFVARVAEERPHSLEVPAGHVLDQSPDGSARRGATVTLVLSDGPRTFELPPLAGAERDEAVAALREENLEVTVDERYDEQVAEGLVIASDPEARTVVEETSTVTLTVSLGREPLDVPDVRGQALEAAQSALRDAELTSEVAGRTFSSDVPEGAVVSQDPGPDATRYRGDTVELVISRGPEPIEVPNLRGDPVAEAVATLESLGFDVEVERQGGFGAFLRPGRVYDQDPGPGATRVPGTTIVLYAYED